MERLTLHLSPTGKASFTIHGEGPSVGQGETKSRLPFGGEARWIATMLKVLDAGSFQPRDFPSEDERHWMVDNGLLKTDPIKFDPKRRERIGQALYSSLFPESSQSRDLFVSALRIAQNKDAQLHLQVKISEDAVKHSRLPDFPWELLHDGREFLAHGQVAFSRYIEIDRPPPNLPPVERINVLLVSSTASDEDRKLPPLPDTELDVIRGALRKVSNVQLSTLETATYDNLRDYLADHRGEAAAHVIHFDGHGLYGRRCEGTLIDGTRCRQIHGGAETTCRSCGAPLPEPQGYLLFHGESGGHRYVSAHELGNLLHSSSFRDATGRSSGPALVVLSACRTALSPPGDSVFNGVAQSLILHRVPAVVALLFRVRVDSMSYFTKQFYRSLGNRNPLAMAVSQGREAMGADDDQWYRPVLYVRWQDNDGGQIFSTVFNEREEREEVTLEIGRAGGGSHDLETYGQVEEVRKGPGKTATLVYLDGATRTVPLLAEYLSPRVTPYPFLGREDLLLHVKQQLMGNGLPGTAGLVYLPGAGKSTMALHVAWDPEVLGHFSDGVLWAGLGRRPDIAAILSQWADALNIPRAEIDYSDGIEERAQVVRDALGVRRMLLVIDDVWETDEADPLLIGGPYCAHLLTTRQPRIVHDLRERFVHVEEVEVPELDADTGLALLTTLAPTAVAAEPTEARKLVEAVGGLPQALILMGLHLNRVYAGEQPRRLHAALKELQEAEGRLQLEQRQQRWDVRPSLPQGVPLSLLALIRISEEALDDESRRTLHALSVFRPKPNYFTEEAALAVTGGRVQTLDALYECGLIETVRGTERYKLQRSIADYASLQLNDEEVGEYHSRAAEFYGGRVTNYVDERQELTSYERWYRYEDPEWQESKAAWLYHLSHTSDRTKAFLSFAEEYFDAFWWWGMYIPFHYCEQLLADWEQTQTMQEVREQSQLLRSFQVAYPVGWQKHGKGDWERVRTSLQELRHLGGLDGHASSLPDEKRHLRAVTDLFLAHSHRYQAVDDSQADDYYREAADLFREADDEWNMGWTEYEIGDMAMERAEANRAIEKSREALTLARKINDYELMGNCYRVQADVHWQLNDMNAAFEHYALALFCGYAFNADPQPPDPYTLAFYREMKERTLARLQAVQTTEGLHVAVDYCVGLRDFWSPDAKDNHLTDSESIASFLREGRWSELMSYVFPDVPDEERLNDRLYLEQYARAAQRVIERVASRIEG